MLSLLPLIICRALAISANVGVGLRSTVYIVFYNTPTLDYTARFFIDFILSLVIFASVPRISYLVYLVHQLVALSGNGLSAEHLP